MTKTVKDGSQEWGMEEFAVEIATSVSVASIQRSLSVLYFLDVHNLKHNSTFMYEEAYAIVKLKEDHCRNNFMKQIKINVKAAFTEV